jgi:hypothetical protein
LSRNIVTGRFGVLSVVAIAAAMAGSLGCSDKGSVPQDIPDLPDADAVSPDSVDGDAFEADAPLPDGTVLPVANPEVAARAFRLYYRERVERTIVAYNRFMLFGDTTFGINIRKAGISRTGDTFEVVPGPNDNNSIGTSVRSTWFAYQVFRSRPLALSLVRMFKGMTFIATVSGHDGITGRNAYPNWTMDIDGTARTVKRTRDGADVGPPTAPDAALEAEILSTFFDGVQMTYRGEPADILLNYMPAQEVASYAVTYGFSMLPSYLRVSDCCTSLMQVPEPYAWAGAFISNHNSRDNFPDLAFGYLAAREAMNDPAADPDVRAAATEAWKAGQSVGDLVQANGGRIMTVSERDPWDQPVVSGGVRPDGTVEAEDLGSMSDCQMTFLARALSTTGLTLPLPELPEPGALDDLLSPIFDPWAGCAPEGTAHTCTRLADAFCGKTWGRLNDLTIGDKGLLDMARELEADTPGTADMVLGHFYGNFDQPLNSMMALHEYARIAGDPALLADATAALGEMTAMYRTFADLIYGSLNPGEQARRRYEAALIDAQSGLAVIGTDLGDFATAEQQMARLEAMLDLQDTAAAALMTDEYIATRVQDELSGASDPVKKRYQDAYGTTPPVRRTVDGYEARTFGPDGMGEWRSVETPHHMVLGGIDLLEALPLCLTSPGALDCAWARLGCARPDLDRDGKVGEADRLLLQQAAVTTGCDATNDWCGGADLDRTGSIDATDTAFMDAAQGCRYIVTATP